MTDFLDVKRKEIADRLQELRPLVDEYHRLEAAEAALAGVSGTPAPAPAAAPARRGRPRAAATAAPARRRGGATRRRRSSSRGGGQTRAIQALELVKGQPGITIPELAAKMGIKQNYLYRVLPGLEKDGQVKKDGRGWVPAGS
ncbi:MAG TPA: hypothetical protein VHX88_21875 [Solirubrobacteraceae bacterium]|jgi:hypothetical protein|nr:hypothetical protein [Solirubrobacteraceae bacterium]